MGSYRVITAGASRDRHHDGTRDEIPHWKQSVSTVENCAAQQRFKVPREFKHKKPQAHGVCSSQACGCSSLISGCEWGPRETHKLMSCRRLLAARLPAGHFTASGRPGPRARSVNTGHQSRLMQAGGAFAFVGDPLILSTSEVTSRATVHRPACSLLPSPQRRPLTGGAR
eukprot:600452-Rhodomonas_salina.1